VHHRAAGEVKSWHLPAQGCIQQTAFAPDHVGHREIHQQRPQRHEEQHPGKFHAFGESARDQRWRNDREHELVDHVRLVGNCSPVIRIRGCAHAIHERVLTTADEWHPLAESHAIADNSPKNGHKAHQHEAMHHSAEDIFTPNQAAVKQRQSRAGHHEHQGGASQHPCVIAGALSGFDRPINVRELFVEIARGLASGKNSERKTQ
jgi:hypothetical protein